MTKQMTFVCTCVLGRYHMTKLSSIDMGVYYMHEVKQPNFIAPA
jgi:hypothetical protein